MLVEDLRLAAGMTRREFAIAISVTEQSVSRWEREGYEVGERKIHPLFRAEMKKIMRKVVAA